MAVAAALGEVERAALGRGVVDAVLVVVDEARQADGAAERAELGVAGRARARLADGAGVRVQQARDVAVDGEVHVAARRRGLLVHDDAAVERHVAVLHVDGDVLVLRADEDEAGPVQPAQDRQLAVDEQEAVA